MEHEMKIFLIICYLIIIAVPFAFSQQVSNNGFESWHSYTGYDVPDSFYTFDQVLFLGSATTVKSTDAHSGNYAALLKVWSGQSSTLPGSLSYGSFQTIGTTNHFWGWPFYGRPIKMKFWYKFLPAGNDTAMATIILSKWNGSHTIVGMGSFYISSNTSSYTLAEIPVNYITGGNPDSIYISFMNGTYKTNPTSGTVFYIDDISLDYITGVNKTKNILPTDYFLSQNFPNPFNPTTTINYSIAKESKVRLNVYNSTGSKVATIINEYKPAGNYSTQFNGSNLASGIYLYRLESGSYSATKKFILMK
jgi:hypothetical protein